MITYCSACGKKIEHKVLEKPNFCPKCGFSFLKGGATPPPDKPIIENVETANIEESLEVAENLTELDFDIEFDMTVRGLSMGSIVDNSGQTAPSERLGKKNKKVSKKQRITNQKKFLEDFKREAGSSRTTQHGK